MASSETTASQSSSGVSSLCTQCRCWPATADGMVCRSCEAAGRTMKKARRIYARDVPYNGTIVSGLWLPESETLEWSRRARRLAEGAGDTVDQQYVDRLRRFLYALAKILSSENALAGDYSEGRPEGRPS